MDYQAVYDAVRSKISQCDMQSAVESAIGNAGISHYAQSVAEEFKNVAYALLEPSVIYRPKLLEDGDKWLAIYGDNIAEGVCGVGSSPREAMRDFDEKWKMVIEKKPKPEIFKGTNDALSNITITK